MERPLITKVANSVEEMANDIAKAIRYLDSQIFNEHLLVSVSYSQDFEEMGLASFLSKGWFFKLLGVKDEYMVFTKSHQAEELRKRPFGIVGTALHEVRKRYQAQNKNCLISVDFARSHRLHFNTEIIDSSILNSEKHPDDKTKKREFDAFLVERIYNQNFKSPKMNRDIIIKLIVCDEKTILEIISSLK
jgi:hypothetical protein